MKRSNTVYNAKQGTHIDIDKRISYHLAGHAAAIHLGNKIKQLPAVNFHIILKHQGCDGQQSDRLTRTNGKNSAKVEGGRLIQSLPLSFAEATRYFSCTQQEEYRCAYEADVINLLAGSLAEAKFVASCDDGVFNANLVYLDALQFYDGSSNIEVITEYMECFIPHKVKRDRKLAELFLAAFSFVNKPSNWQAISALAKFVRDETKDIIHCEDVISFLESCFVEETVHYSTPLPGYL
jgi:hypothetical protein